MDFTNERILIDELPSLDNVAFRPLEKEYLKVLRVTFILFGVLILLIVFAVFYFIKKTQLPGAIYFSAVSFVVLSTLGWMSDSISFRYSGYALREKDIIFRRGWFIRKTRIIPLKRIQHVSVQSGPIERKFQLASISLYTAGSDEADITIKGITEEKALQIKEWISTKLNE